MKRLISLFTLLTFVISSSTFAFSVPKPAKCPSVGAIQNGGLQAADKDENSGLYVAVQIDQYDTPEIWGFLIGIPISSASSAEDALDKARLVLPALSGNPKPFPFDEGRWECSYNDFTNGYKAHAITPLELVNTSSSLEISAIHSK